MFLLRGTNFVWGKCSCLQYCGGHPPPPVPTPIVCILATVSSGTSQGTSAVYFLSLHQYLELITFGGQRVGISHNDSLSAGVGWYPDMLHFYERSSSLVKAIKWIELNCIKRFTGSSHFKQIIHKIPRRESLFQSKQDSSYIVFLPETAKLLLLRFSRQGNSRISRATTTQGQK